MGAICEKMGCNMFFNAKSVALADDANLKNSWLAGSGFATGVRVGAAGGRPAAPRPSAGPPAAAAGPIGGAAVGVRLCGGPSALGLGAAVDTGPRPSHLSRGDAGL